MKTFALASAPLWGAATGVGSMPGEDPHESAAVVAGELPALPHLVELPARGPGADMVGRAVALLVDLHGDVQPSGWRLVDRPGTDERRARSYLGHDLDELEAARRGAAGAGGPVKTQACGPWTAAAALRLSRGEPVLSDRGAVRDLVASLTEGLRLHVADLRRRLPDAPVVLQLDEPALPMVLLGGIRSSSGARNFAPVPESDAETVLRSVRDAMATMDVPVVVHCCADRPPVALLHRAGVAGLSLDLTLLPARLEEELGAALEHGLALLAGVVPTSGNLPPDAGAAVAPVRRLWHRLGLPAEGLREVVVTPTCGLAGLAPERARAALALARDGARRLADDPDRTEQ